MNCQAFSSLVGNIITDVCCLELEVKVECKDGEFCFCFVPKNEEELKNGYLCCKDSQSPIRKNPAVYLFLADNEEFAYFLGYSYIAYYKYWRQSINSERTETNLGINSKRTEKNLEVFNNLKNCTQNKNFTSYVPLYIGSTNDFSSRYENFSISILSGINGKHTFGEKLHNYLKDICRVNKLYQYSMKMCLVVFYTNEDEKSNGKGYEKDKAECIEHFILKHTNFCKIFNDEDGDCLGIQKIRNLVEEIKKTTEKIKKITEEIKKELEEIENIIIAIKEKVKEAKEINENEKTNKIKETAEKIANKAKEIEENIDQKISHSDNKKAEKIKEKASKIKEIAENIAKKAAYIPEAIQIANSIIQTIQNLQSCP
jgi:hypothetical protein